MSNRYDTVRPMAWSEDTLQLLDQRLLPHQQMYIRCDDVAGVARAIADMVVRGAPAIGIAAAYGVVLAVRHRYAQSPSSWKQDITADLRLLTAARPTAINLAWAVDRMQRLFDASSSDPLNGDPSVALLAEAQRIHQEDIEANRRMGELGAGLIEGPSAVLTHCNAGSLATGGYGTALGVIRSAFVAGKVAQVYADETRPWLQGARLTAWELLQDGIPVTILVDGAAAHLMKQGRVQWVVVGSDRIAANGDVANKIGTYSLAICARFHQVRFMVVAPTSTVDLSIPDGHDIPIEERSSDEVLQLAGEQLAAPGSSGWNPVFDVVPAHLVDAIVTEKGVVLEPDAKKIAAMMQSG